MTRSAPSRDVRIAHLPALDGLRGLAVLGVLLFHGGHLQGGYLGVDLFFVLSGYLITALLLAEHRRQGHIALGAFWVRRAKRLLPALFALLPLVALYAAFVAEKTELARIRGDGLATLAYVANWHTILAERSYWELFAAPSPLEHTWSLAIEEQFYVLWPLLVAWVLHRARGAARPLAIVCAVLSLASAVAMLVLFRPDASSRVYLGTDTRGAAITLGALLACVRSGDSKPLGNKAIRVLDGAGVLSLLGLGAAWVLLDGQSPFLYRGGFWLTEGLVLVLIVCAAEDRRSLVARALSFRPLAMVGLVSYGLYLYHWPLFVLLRAPRVPLDGAALTALRLAATFALSAVSYFVLEQPIRRRGLPPWLRPIWAIPAAFLLSIAALIATTQGAETPDQVNVERASPSAEDRRPRLLVVGDSVSVALGAALHAVERDFGRATIVRGKGDCSILHDQFVTTSLNNRAHDGGDCDAAWTADAAELQPETTLVVLGGGFFAPSVIDGQKQRACEPGWRREYARELARNLAALRADGGRVRLVLVPDPVGEWTGVAPHATIACFNDTLREAALAAGGIALLDLAGQLCPEGVCAKESRGAPIRPDGLHFDGPGAEETARWVWSQLSPASP
jgi:peptidoglycan/LPS O-acetylase OafA/YrhL